MRSPRILALDCGAAHIAGGLFSVGPHRRLRLERYFSETFSSDPSMEAGWEQRLGQKLETIISREKITTVDCVLAVPGHLALTKLVKTPSVNRENRARIVQFEASQNIPYPLDEVAWGHLELNDDGVDLKFMLSAAKLDAMESLCRVVESGGVKISRAETTSMALKRAYELCFAAGTKSVGLVDIGARSTQVIFIGPNTLHVRTLSMGGNVVTQTLAAHLDLDFESAERLKIQVTGLKFSSHPEC